MNVRVIAARTSWAILVMLAAGCVHDPNSPRTVEECGPIPFPRLGDVYEFAVEALPLGVLGGVPGDVFSREAAIVLGNPHANQGVGDAGRRAHDWTSNATLVLRFETTTVDGATFQISYSLRDSTAEALVYREWVGDDMRLVASNVYGRTAGGEPYGGGGAFLRLDTAGLPAAFGTSLLWGTLIGSESQVADDVWMPQLFLTVKPPTLAQGWPSWPGASMRYAPSARPEQGCTVSYHAVTEKQDGGTDRWYFGSHSYRLVMTDNSSMPLMLSGPATLIHSEQGSGEGVDQIDRPPQTSSEEPWMPAEEGFEGNEFGFATSISAALDAARANEPVAHWLAAHPSAVMTALQHFVWPQNSTAGAAVDAWDLEWAGGADGIHVTVTRHRPEQPLLPPPLGQPPAELRVASHEGHLHSSGAGPSGSAISIGKMKEQLVQWLNDMEVDSLACGLTAGACILYSDEGWPGPAIRSPGMGQRFLDAERFGNAGVFVHIHDGQIAHARLPDYAVH